MLMFLKGQIKSERIVHRMILCNSPIGILLKEYKLQTLSMNLLLSLKLLSF